MKVLSLFSPSLPRHLVYMLQQSGYSARQYLSWFWRAPDIGSVIYRKTLDPTPKAKLLLGGAWAVIGVQLLSVAGLLLLADNFWLKLTGLGWLLLVPIITAHVLPLVVLVGSAVLQRPKEARIIEAAQQLFSSHPAIKIAVAGSFGKTTMKDMLTTVVAQGKKVAASPGNLNTPLGLAEFAKSLEGDEEVLVIEYGESHPGDIAQLCWLTQPNYGVITGVNEAHLETMGSLETAADTIFELADALGQEFVVGNGESLPVRKRAGAKMYLYNQKGIGKWKVSNAECDIDGTRFTLSQGKKSIKVNVQLLGKHQIGPLSAVIDIADALGLSVEQIEKGLAAIRPFEHRFQKLELHGATVIDDTYNGNIDGMKAGIDFVASVKAKRKVYVTPGLVDTASQKARLHKDIGQRAAKVFDLVVLIKNSNAPFIKQGLTKGGFKGELLEIDDPLGFYQNLESFVAGGDLVLMQNDLTDNYA